MIIHFIYIFSPFYLHVFLFIYHWVLLLLVSETYLTLLQFGISVMFRLHQMFVWKWEVLI